MTGSNRHANAVVHATLLDALGEGVYGVDAEGLCTFINPAALEMLGWTEADVLGRNQHWLFHHHYPDGREYPEAECPIHQTLRDGKYRSAEEFFYKKDGQSFPVALTATPLAQQGVQTGVVVVFRDMTQLRKIQDSLRTIAESSVGAGNEVFLFLARHLAQSQNKRFALISRLDPGEQSVAYTLAAWDTHGFVPDFSYPLAGTPCNDVIRKGSCFFERDVRTLFPDSTLLVELQAESYWATALLDSQGQAIGILALVDDQPMQEDAQTFSLLKSFAARATAELERLLT